MRGPKIPHNGYVLVGDGEQALFLRNEGDQVIANLAIDPVVEPRGHPYAAERLR